MLKPQLLEYHIADNIRAFSTLRHEGYSKEAYASFNITHYCGDIEECVMRNRELLCKELDIDARHLIIPQQTHGKNVLDINESFLTSTHEKQQEALLDIDAVITQCSQICIGVSTADCVPVLLYDTRQKAIAAIHCGWRGVIHEIICSTITKMQDVYQTEAKDIVAVIAPSISQDAFEVGDDVYHIFSEKGWDMSEIARRYPTPKGTKWHIDLWAACCIQLEQMGVALRNIQVAGICTYQSPERFFSARRDGINSGRIFNGIMMLA